MDRNYFLSYGQIVFLLLLSAIGKLNASIISATVNEPELLCHNDAADTDLYPYLSGIFSQKLVSSLDYMNSHHINYSDDVSYVAFENSLQNGLPVVNDKDFFLLPMKDLESIPTWHKWRSLSFAGQIDILSIIRQIKRFYISSVKLIDGFKFIIKIPDKLTTFPIY
ncbi:hypothetical protein [Chryseobacterium contaminans]|uniref:hypothetical protein n=1 Tax=Chryseobacterium contaminans TaxID=1423959 RepID=UPI00301998BF